MPLFDNLIKDIGTRFDLGSKAGPLIQELIGLIGGQQNGVAGFLNMFRSAGLSSEVESWLGKTDGAALSAPQMEQALGGSIGDIAGKLGLNRSAVGAALGYALPKVIGMLTPGGVIPTIIPASAENFLDAAAPGSPSRVNEFLARRAEQAARGGERRSREADRDAEASSVLRRWLAPAAAALVVIGLLGYFASDKVGHRADADSAALAPKAEAPPAPTVPARLALINENGLIVYSGAVRDNATRALIIASFKKAFGPDNISGDLIVDRRAYPAVWASNLKLAALHDFKTPGAQALFEGDTVSIGGALSGSDRDKILSSLKSALGTQYVFTTLAEGAAPSSLAALKPGFGGNDLVGALNRSSFDFAANSAEIAPSARILLRQAASLMKQLPAGTKVRIGGYADKISDPAADMQRLSQQRADAVRQALVDGGVDPVMVSAKGFGAAGSATVEGRSSDSGVGRARVDRRIEFMIVQ